MSLLIKGIDMPELYKTYEVRFVEEYDRIIIGMAIGTSSAYRPLGEVVIVSTPYELLTMDDLISRAAAIRWVKTECNPYGKPTLDFESGKKVIKHLEKMPSTIMIEAEK